MKKLFIYYSLSGNGDVVSEYLSSSYDIRKVTTAEPLPGSYFFSILVGGFKAMKNHKDKLYNFDNDIKDYDEIIIGSPIWNDRLCTPINGVLNELDLTNKKVNFVLYSGSGKNINEKYKVVPYVLKAPKNNNKELNKLKELL